MAQMHVVVPRNRSDETGKLNNQHYHVGDAHGVHANGGNGKMKRTSNIEI